MPLIMNGVTIPENVANVLNYNGTNITSVIFNGTTVWTQSLLMATTAGTSYTAYSCSTYQHYDWYSFGSRTFQGANGSGCTIIVQGRDGPSQWNSDANHCSAGGIRCRGLHNGAQVVYATSIGGCSLYSWGGYGSASVNRTINYNDTFTFQAGGYYEGNGGTTNQGYIQVGSPSNASTVFV
jgi:hypothetical protein